MRYPWILILFKIEQGTQNTDQLLLLFSFTIGKSAFSQQIPISINSFLKKIFEVLIFNIFDIVLCFYLSVANCNILLEVQTLSLDCLNVRKYLLLYFMVSRTGDELFPIFIDFEEIFLIFNIRVHLLHLNVCFFAHNKHWDFMGSFYFLQASNVWNDVLEHKHNAISSRKICFFVLADCQFNFFCFLCLFQQLLRIKWISHLNAISKVMICWVLNILLIMIVFRVKLLSLFYIYFGSLNRTLAKNTWIILNHWVIVNLSPRYSFLRVYC